MNIAIYISNHGFGHATRMCALAEELIKKGHFCFINTDRPKFLFDSLDKNKFSYSKKSLDFGIKHINWQIPNIEETEEELLKFWQNKEKLIEDEIVFCQKNRIKLIIGDIPPLAFEIAFRQKIKSIAISNFNWYFNYENMLTERVSHIVKEIYSYYKKVDYTIQLPFSNDLAMLPAKNLEKVGLLTRKAENCRKALCNEFDIDSEKLLVLVSFGAGDENPVNMNDLRKVNNLKILSKKDLNGEVIIPDNYDFAKLLASVDVVITKTGYSTLAESVQAGTFIIYTDRQNFAEDELLIEGLKNYENSRFISQKKIHKTNWEEVFSKIKIEKNSKIDNNNMKISNLIEKYIT